VHQRIADADEGGGQEDGGDVVNLFPFEVRSKLGRKKKVLVNFFTKLKSETLS